MPNVLRIRGEYYIVEHDNDKESYRLNNKDNKDKKNFWPSYTENSLGLLDGEAKPKIYTLLQREIEPWLSTLFQSEHLSLLVGSGLSTAVSIFAAKNQTEKEANRKLAKALMRYKGSKGKVEGKLWRAVRVAAEKRAKTCRRKNPNLEDQISAMKAFINNLDALKKFINSLNPSKNLEETYLEDRLKRILAALINRILKQERSIIGEDRAQDAAQYLIRFLMSFASRPSSPRNRLNIFTTNYDRVIEYGATLAGLHLLDRFVGPLNPILRSSRLDLDMHYHPPGIRGEPRYVEGVTRFTKLHGSLDWIYDSDGKQVRRVGLPFGEESSDPYIKGKTSIIYPNTDKDIETSYYPYVELMRDYAAAVCRPNSTLVLYGYGLGDEHINRVIEDMLTIPSTHLVIIAYEDTGGKIKKLYAKHHHAKDRITLLIGPQLADLETLVNYYLPVPALEPQTINMQKLLEQRGWDKDAKKSNDPPNGGK